MALNFDSPPQTPLWKLALKGGKKLKEGETVPQIEAGARQLSGDLEAYRAVCGFARKDPLPLSWPAVLIQPLQLAIFADPAFPLPVMGIVHSRQKIRWYRPIRAEEPLSGNVRVEGHRVVRSGGEVDLCGSVFVGEEKVWEGVTTILSRAIQGSGEEKKPSPEVLFPHERSVSWKVPADQGLRYAKVSGDYNPIHVSALGARIFGFARPIAHGWWTLARALAELDEDLPAAGELNVRFVDPVPLPGKVVFSAGRLDGRLCFSVVGKKPCILGEISSSS